MTICIAAICESGKQIVLAADRMFTAPAPLNIEFQTEEGKIEQISPTCVALTSGNSAFATEVLDVTRRELGGSQEPLIGEVANIVKEAYIHTRSQKIYETIITTTLGQDYADYIGRGGTTLATYLQPQQQVYQQLIAMSQQFNMGLEIIVTGLDRDGTFIARVTHPGTLARLDKLGYDAVGSGGIHALTKLQLGAQTFRRGLIETLVAVYEAKKAAEVAPGVGDNTDMAVVDIKELRTCSAAVIEALGECLSEINRTSKPDLSKVMEAYAKSSPKS